MRNSGGYQGPAPEPNRSLNIDTGEPQDYQPEGGFDPDKVHFTEGQMAVPSVEVALDKAPAGREFEEPRQAPFLPAGVQETPPPAAPEEASRIASLEDKINGLVERLGQEREEAQRLQAERDLRHQVELAHLQGALQTQQHPQQSEEFDPSEPMTRGEFMQAAQNLMAFNQAATLRAMHQIQPQEEQMVLQQNPGLQNLPEPQRTQLTVQAVQMLRSSQRRRGPQPGPTSGSGPSAQARPTGRTVPHRETRPAPTAPDLRPENPQAKVQAEYARAQAIKDPTERLQAMKTVMKKAVETHGVRYEDFLKGSFNQT